MNNRHPIHRAFPQAIPNTFAISREGAPPCQSACPADVNVVGYMNLTGLGKFEEALSLVRENMPFAAICGRICFHPCETLCKRGQLDSPLSICDTKRFLGDWEMKQSVYKTPPKMEDRDKKVAIVGAGPAGLSAAYYLCLNGYDVTVFEKLPVLGGMLSVGIPEYRLPRDIIATEIKNLETLGVTFQTGISIGHDKTLTDLESENYKACFIATGMHQCPTLGVAGQDLEGVIPGVDFLRKVAFKESVVLGEKAVIIGGGNVAIDCARTCLRMGVKEVSILYRRSREEMPAYDYEVKEAEQEGIRFIFLAAPVRFIGEAHKLKSVEYI